MIKYQWRQKLFGRSIEFTNNRRFMGHLESRKWGREYVGYINQEEIVFKSTGLFKLKLDIINNTTGEHIGEITHNTWGTRYIVNLEKEYVFKQISFWRGIWGMFDGSKQVSEIKGGFSKGTITSYIDHPILALAAYYIRRLQWSQAAAAA